jgi:hypothetical protein
MLVAVEINLALWGHDRLRVNQGSGISLLVNQPSNEIEGGPAKRDPPCDGDDASKGEPCPGPERKNALQAGCGLSRRLLFDVL